MATADSVKTKMQGLIDSANATTGASDATLTDAVNTLIAGFGSSSSEDFDILDSVLGRDITEFIDDRITSLGRYAFAKCTSLKTVSLANANYVWDNAFQECVSLKTVNLPLITAGQRSVFMGCTGLEEICLPNLLNTINESASGSGYFGKCYRLRKVDLPSLNTLGNNTFNQCNSLTQLILRSPTICTLNSSATITIMAHFTGTVNAAYNPDGLKDGYIYVPSALIEEYKAATNWSTFADQFRSLEYYTVDGTTTGELDENKI